MRAPPSLRPGTLLPSLINGQEKLTHGKSPERLTLALVFTKRQEDAGSSLQRAQLLVWLHFLDSFSFSSAMLRLPSGFLHAISITELCGDQMGYGRGKAL